MNEEPPLQEQQTNVTKLWRAEFAAVVVIAFGYFIVSSLYIAFSGNYEDHISDKHLQFLLIFESIIIVILSVLLRWRGWRLQDFGIAPTPLGTLIGVGLAFACVYAYYESWFVVSAIAAFFHQQIYVPHLITGPLNLTTAVAVSIVNPIFEEVFVCGYVITALKRHTSTQTAINASVTIRLLYHLYQGAAGVIGIVPLGLIFAYWYGRTGRLWPLIVAHGLLDFYAFWSYINGQT